MIARLSFMYIYSMLYKYTYSHTYIEIEQQHKFQAEALNTGAKKKNHTANKNMLTKIMHAT